VAFAFCVSSSAVAFRQAGKFSLRPLSPLRLGVVGASIRGTIGWRPSGETLHLFQGSVQDEFGGTMFLDSRRRASSIASSIRSLGEQRMRDCPGFHQPDVRAAYLLQRKFVIEERFLADYFIQLPFHQFRRHSLGLAERCAVEFGEFGESLPRALDSVELPCRSLWRQLAIETVLLIAREKARASPVRDRGEPSSAVKSRKKSSMAGGALGDCPKEGAAARVIPAARKFRRDKLLIIVPV
jgi:hypothetical protein